MLLLRDSFFQSLRVFWLLLKLSLPILILIKWLEDRFGFIAWVGEWLDPVMQWVGLPGAAGVVWATAIFLQIYAALVVAVSLWEVLDLSVAQISGLSLMILIAHNVIVEARVTQLSGVRMIRITVFRLFIALLCGGLVTYVCLKQNWLQQAAVHVLGQETMPKEWGPWAWVQMQTWAKIGLIIFLSMLFINLLKALGLEKHLLRMLLPILRPFGIGPSAVTITFIGMTLGLAYGSGLLIDQAQKGKIPKHDLICAILMLSLLHGLIEDTLLMLLLGADWMVVLLFRIAFSLIIVMAFSLYFTQFPQAEDKWLNRFFWRRPGSHKKLSAR